MDFIAVDLETTGFSHNYDSILQIGAVKIIDDKPAGEFNVYIRMTKKVPKEVTEITGITNELLNEKGVPYARALHDFVQFIGDLDMVSHNASFDHRFLYEKIRKKVFHYMNNQFNCTMQLARKKLPQLPNHKLDTVASHLGIPNISHHDALNDAKVCADILMHLGGKQPLYYRKSTEPKRTTGLLDAFVDMKHLKTQDWRKL